MKLPKRLYEYITIINHHFKDGDVAANSAFKMGNGAFTCFESATFSYTYVYKNINSGKKILKTVGLFFYLEA